MIGIKLPAHNDDDEARLRLRVFALLAYRTIASPMPQPVCEIAEVAAAVMNRQLPPGESLLCARDTIGRMAAEDVLVATGEGELPFTKIALPPRAIEYASGGRRSLGFLTLQKLVAGVPLDDLVDRAPRRKEEPKAIPTAKSLAAKMSAKVVGLGEQVRSLSSLLVMHLARAQLLRSGRDEGSNISVLLVSSSGAGKTWLMRQAGEASGVPFASMSATAMTSEGYVGGKVDDLFRALVTKTKGDLAAARFGIAFTDEWDKKAIRHDRDVTTLAVQQEFLVPVHGGEFNITGKRAMERQMMFNSVGTFFAFAGAFSGLSEMIRKKSNDSSIGFTAGTSARRRDYILDSIREYGFLREWVNRLTAVMFLPDPTLASLEVAAAGGVLNSLNAVLGEVGVVLHPHECAVRKMAEYALESRTFYRGVQAVWQSVAQAAVGDGMTGGVLVGRDEVESAIARVRSGSVGGDSEGDAPQEAPEAQDHDRGESSGGAGG
jgi:ATP-dependent Clp protease ATP-binding subunit ClpX